MTAEAKSNTFQVLGFALALLLQTATIVWWASGVQKDVDQASLENTRQATQIDQIASDQKRIEVAAATVGAQLQGVRDTLADLRDGQKELNELVQQMTRIRP